MSEIYLTKIERKTIFTKSLIFGLIMFIISDLTVTGPFYFNFLPWMYILGTLGSIKKIDSVLMCVISAFTVFIATLITNGMWSDCVLATLVTIVNLVLGIITGRICHEFILEHRLVKYIKRSKKIMYIITVSIMFLASCLIVALNSGNVITYLKSKSNLDKYIIKTYGVQDYTVTKVRYESSVPGKYVYKVNIKGEEVYFVPVTNEIFKDANRDTRYLMMQRELENETVNMVSETLKKYSSLKNGKVKYAIDYNSFAVNSKVTTLTLEYSKNDLGITIDNEYAEIRDCIKELQTKKPTDKIVISIDGKILELPYEDIEKLTVEYIKGGFEIEEIS